ncbi:MAG: hypothetical protein GX455_15060 [Phycisphaerae bacterium]|nr:hypothetical protein [Phycisphaerae bacterium]
MSYDLYFSPRTGKLDAEQFKEYFQKRPLYKLQGSQAWYQNDDTGVYFSFEFNDSGDSEEEGQPGFPVSLNINYFRPSYFILEAEPEVSEFVKAFDLTVSDPQEGGMGEGEYRKDLLISGWNQGNEFGCSAMLKHPKRQEDVATLPSAMLHQVWKWNLGRKTLQEHIGNEQFVASVMFLRYENRTVSFATWIDAIPTVLPRVEMILIGRNKLARRRFLLKRNDIALASWEQANQAIQIEKYPAIGMGYSLKYDNPPAEIVEFVKGLTAYSDTLAGLPADQVLDRELVVKLSR